MSILSLDEAPKSKAMHIWADFLELHCLASPDNIASVDAAAKEAKSQTDNGVDTELFDDISSPSSTLSPEEDDYVVHVAEDALRLAKRRSSFYGDFYPFNVDFTGKEISLKSDVTFEQKLYIALLLCTNNTYCNSHRDVFTLGFEEISKYAFKGVLPPEGHVWHLGTCQKGEEDMLELKTNKFIGKIKAIAAKLKLDVIADEAEFTAQNTGDGGIDLIGLIPMHDGVNGEELISFGQSATSKGKDEINKKQGDAAYSKWNKWIKFKTPTGNYLFISASIRRHDGDFIQGFPRNSDAILIDRGRIISFISNWRERSISNSVVSIIPNKINDCISKLVA